MKGAGLFSWARGVMLLGGLAAAARAETPQPLDYDLGEPLGAYTAERGYGFDLDTQPEMPAFYFSARVPEGNWRVTVTLGGERESETTVRAESRRLMLEKVRTRPGETVEGSFVVNVRTPRLDPPPPNAPGGDRVRLNDREVGVLHWDDKLTLEFSSTSPAVRRVRIEPAKDVVTLFLAGDSTVTDQPYEPAASWGQMLPRFCNDRVAVANHAESGETMKSFLTALRFDKLLSAVRPGDYVLIQFGHNDSKAQWPQTYAAAETTYRDYLRVYVGEVRRRGATPVLLTSVHRRVFDEQGHIRNTHGGYLDAVREVARAEDVAFIDLAAASATLYEALGPARAPLAFNDGGRDPTHHNNYGAYQLARAVVDGLRDLRLPVSEHILADLSPFDPAHPPAPESFGLPPSPRTSTLRPRGN